MEQCNLKPAVKSEGDHKDRLSNTRQSRKIQFGLSAEGRCIKKSSASAESRECSGESKLDSLRTDSLSHREPP